MNLHVILLLLAIQGLVPIRCEGHSGEEVSGEGPLEEEDWSGSSDSSTDEDENFKGFASGSSSADGGRDDEGLRTFPRVSQTYSNKRFVTSGVGEDKGGSQDDDSSNSKSNGRQDQGSAYENLESNMDLAKIGDAIDVMKKLKKAKSDQEFAKKLRSGPESLGVAFKTFEQLSGLWISVMHRIWRVWKAKGAKVVMHSIVHDLLNKTGKAIKQKVGKMLSKKTVVGLNGSGSATFKDEGPTEPEQSHHPTTIHNHTALPVQRVSIDFIKNISKEESTSSSTKTVKEPVEKVKVSFFSRKVNDSKAIQKSAIQRQPNRVSEKSNDTLVAKETSTDKGKENITEKGEKAPRDVDVSSMVAASIKSTTTPRAKETEHISKPNHTLDSRDSKKNAHDISMGFVGKSISHNISVTAQKVTQHIGKNNVVRERKNATEKLSRDQRVRDSVNTRNTTSQSDVTHAQEETVKQIPAEHVNETTKQFNKSDKDSSIINSSLTQIKNDPQEKISQRTNEALNKTDEKTRVLETLKIDFLKKNRTLNQNNSSVTQISDLETRRNVELSALHNASNSKTDSAKVVVLSKSSPLVSGTDNAGASALDKNIPNHNKSDGVTNSAGVQEGKEVSSNKGIDKDTRTRTTTLAKSEKIIVNLDGKQDTSKESKRNIFLNATRTASRANDQEVNGDRLKNTTKGKTSASALQRKTQTIKTDLDANSAQLKMKSTDVHNKEHKINTSSANISIKEDGSKNSVDSTNVQPVQKHLQQLNNGRVETSNTKSGALDSSKGNKTIAMVNAQVTKIDKSPSQIDSKSSQSHDGSSKDSKSPRVGPEQEQNALNNSATQPVDKMKEKVDKKQTEGGSGNSGKSVDDFKDASNKKMQDTKEILTTNTSHTRIAKTSQKLERSDHSQGTTSNVYETSVKNIQDDGESLSVKKDQSNTESRTLQDKNNTEIQPKVKIIKPRNNAATSSLIQNSTSITPVNPVVKGSENSVKTTQHPHLHNSLKANEKDLRISPVELTGSHKVKSENPKIEKQASNSGDSNSRDNGLTHIRETIAHGPESRGTLDLGSGVTHDSKSGVTHDPESEMTGETGSGVTHVPEPIVTHSPGSGTTHAPSNVSTEPVINTTNHHSKRVSEQESNSPQRTSGSPQKQSIASQQTKMTLTKSTKKPSVIDLDNAKSSSTPRTNGVNNVHFKKVKSPPKPKHVTQASRRTKAEERPQSNRAKEGHRVTSHENSKNNDQAQPTKMQSSSSWTEPIPTNLTKEEINPSKPQQVDVLTSRTPPTSLLTTSDDDNTYSIKQIVQGPRGSSYIYGNHHDEKVHKLEKQVSKLENEVTVLETAMADLAKRLLVVEQKSEVPRPTTAAIFPPPTKLPEPHDQRPVHNQQHTTVYVAKDLGTTPLTPVPQSGPEKIVIPISSLYPGGAGSVTTPSASMRERVHQETKVDNHSNEEDQEKPPDGTNLSVHDGTRTAPSSEAHAVVRPIVNIIVPNNRADLLSEGALCVPRCQNGGRCLDRNTCRCPTFFTGDHCERFSLRDLLESPTPRERPYRKLQRIVVSEPPDRQVLDGTLNLDPGSPALEYRDLNQDLEPGKEYVAKQQPIEVASPSNSAEVDSGARRRQLILEI